MPAVTSVEVRLTQSYLEVVHSQVENADANKVRLSQIYAEVIHSIAASGATEIDGDLDATESGSDTVTITSDPVGTLSVYESSDTASFTDQLIGDLNVTETGDTAEFASGITGSLDATDGADTALITEQLLRRPIAAVIIGVH